MRQPVKRTSMVALAAQEAARQEAEKNESRTILLILSLDSTPVG